MYREGNLKTSEVAHSTEAMKDHHRQHVILLRQISVNLKRLCLPISGLNICKHSLNRPHTQKTHPHVIYPSIWNYTQPQNDVQRSIQTPCCVSVVHVLFHKVSGKNSIIIMHRISKSRRSMCTSIGAHIQWRDSTCTICSISSTDCCLCSLSSSSIL